MTLDCTKLDAVEGKIIKLADAVAGLVGRMDAVGKRRADGGPGSGPPPGGGSGKDKLINHNTKARVAANNSMAEFHGKEREKSHPAHKAALSAGNKKEAAKHKEDYQYHAGREQAHRTGNFS